MFTEKHSIEPNVFINILSSIIGRWQDLLTVDIEAAKPHSLQIPHYKFS